jgi:hypothetical protein
MFIGYPVPWLIPLAINGIGLVTVHWFLVQRLRQAFPAVWTQLGCPAFSFSTSVREGWKQEKAGYRLFWFIWSGRHVALQDSTVGRLVWCARLGYGLVIIFFVLGWINGTLAFHSGD